LKERGIEGVRLRNDPLQQKLLNRFSYAAIINIKSYIVGGG